jgi:hypothetical protein
VGGGPGAGLVTTVDYHASMYSPSSLFITCQIRNGRDLQFVVKVVLYLEKATAITRENITTDKTDRLLSTFSLGKDDRDMIAGLEDDSTPVKRNPFEDLSRLGSTATEDNTEPALLMIFKCVSLESVQLSFSRGDVALQWYEGNKVSYCPDIRDTLKATIASADVFDITITTQDSPLAKEMWDRLLQHCQDDHIFDPLMSNCNLRHQDLSFATFNLDAPRPDKSIPRVHVFKNQTHQTCALIGGSTDSIKYELEVAEKMAEVEIPFIATASPYSLWKGTKDDLITYGIQADNSPTEMTLFCAISEHYSLPPENTTCIITLQQPDRSRTSQPHQDDRGTPSVTLAASGKHCTQCCCGCCLCIRQKG